MQHIILKPGFALHVDALFFILTCLRFIVIFISKKSKRKKLYQKFLPSFFRKRLLNERLWERSKMKNVGIQTEERKSSTSAQTDFIRRLNSLHTIEDVRASASISTDSSEEEEEGQQKSQKNPGHSGKVVKGEPKIQRKRGLSRKKLYIYNIGD